MNFIRLAIFSVLCWSLSLHALGQDSVIDNVRAALKAGSSRELVKYFSDVVELKIDGENSNYSRTQAEFVLKEFFRSNEAQGFEYVFEGNSREGLKYAIGTYTYKDGTYRVYILFKKAGASLVIDTLDFTKE